jgi:hypothetical protein
MKKVFPWKLWKIFLKNVPIRFWVCKFMFLTLNLFYSSRQIMCKKPNPTDIEGKKKMKMNFACPPVYVRYEWIKDVRSNFFVLNQVFKLKNRFCFFKKKVSFFTHSRNVHLNAYLMYYPRKNNFFIAILHCSILKFEF